MKKRSAKSVTQKAANISRTSVKQPWYKQNLNISVGRVKTVDIAMMSKHLAVMLSAGLTVPDALDVITDQSQGPLHRVLRRVNKRVQGGSAFSDALERERKIFPPLFSSAVRIGENSGTLDANLTRLAEQMERDLNLRRNVQSALIYPSVVLSLAFILGFGVSIYVLPQIADIFESLRVDLPLSTRILIRVARFFDLYGVITAIGLVALAFFVYWGIRRRFLKPLVDNIALRLPVFGTFLHLVNRARFCRTLGTLLESGTPIEEALEITRDVMPNHQYEVSVKVFLKKISSGSELAELIALYPHLYPKIIERMTAVGEHSASLGKTLAFLADYYEERVLVMSKNLSSLIEPFLLILIGSVVAGLAISILTPIYSVLSGVSG